MDILLVACQHLFLLDTKLLKGEVSYFKHYYYYYRKSPIVCHSSSPTTLLQEAEVNETITPEMGVSLCVSPFSFSRILGMES